MDDVDWKDFEYELTQKCSYNELSDDILVGVSNGYSFEEQRQILINELK